MDVMNLLVASKKLLFCSSIVSSWVLCLCRCTPDPGSFPILQDGDLTLWREKSHVLD